MTIRLWTKKSIKKAAFNMKSRRKILSFKMNLAE